MKTEQEIIAEVSARNRECHQAYFDLIKNLIDRESDPYIRAEMINEVNDKLLWALKSVRDISGFNGPADTADVIKECASPSVVIGTDKTTAQTKADIWAEGFMSGSYYGWEFHATTPFPDKHFYEVGSMPSKARANISNPYKEKEAGNDK